MIPRYLPITLAAATLAVGCASAPQLVVDPKSITSEVRYKTDFDECRAISRSYDRGDATVKNAAVGTVVGGTAVAGVATAVAGAVFLPAIPFIVAGAALGGLAGGGTTKISETKAQEHILAECMAAKGYSVFKAE
jgi:hypothetical protein